MATRSVLVTVLLALHHHVSCELMRYFVLLFGSTLMRTVETSERNYGTANRIKRSVGYTSTERGGFIPRTFVRIESPVNGKW